MSNTSLTSTKQRLSALFTLIVLFVTLLLVYSYLSYKYISTARIEKTQTITNSINLREQISRSPRTLDTIRMYQWDAMQSNISPSNDLNFINFIILDNLSGKVLFWNVNRNIDVEALEWIMLQEWFFSQDSILLSVLNLQWLQTWKTLVVFRELSYSYSEFLRDVIRFTFIALLSSILI